MLRLTPLTKESTSALNDLLNNVFSSPFLPSRPRGSERNLYTVTRPELPTSTKVFGSILLFLHSTSLSYGSLSGLRLREIHVHLFPFSLSTVSFQLHYGNS